MSRNRLAVIRPLVGLLFLGLFAGVAPAHAVAKEPLKVLLTGDSITQGFNGDFTWRYRLDKEFIRQGVPVDFVGSRHDPYAKPGWSSAQYADPNFDRDHFAQASSTLQVEAARIKDEVTRQQPDLIVLMAGINDMRGGATAATTNARLRTWISRAREARPDVRLVISPVLDARDPARPSLSTTISQFDQMLGPTVRALSTPQSPITMADTTRGWSVTTHTSEDLHPSAYGETLVAQRIAECLETIGVLPQTPSIYHWTPWNRQPRLKIVMQGTHAVLSWDWQAISSARVSIQRVGHRASFPVNRYGHGTMTTSALVQRATYDFRVQLIRGRMATPLGPATRVTVSVAGGPLGWAGLPWMPPVSAGPPRRRPRATSSRSRGPRAGAGSHGVRRRRSRSAQTRLSGPRSGRSTPLAVPRSASGSAERPGGAGASATAGGRGGAQRAGNHVHAPQPWAGLRPYGRLGLEPR